MKRVGINGFFTRKDLVELIEVFVQKGARYAAMTFHPAAVRLCDANLLVKQIDPTVRGVWLSANPFSSDLRSNRVFDIDVSASGAFAISFQRCDVEHGALVQTSLGTTTSAEGEQLKIWESGLRLWKKRIVRDVHIYSYVMKQAYPNEKMNVSMDAIAGYERGDWNLVSPSGQNPALIIHPLAAKRAMPFSI